MQALPSQAAGREYKRNKRTDCANCSSLHNNRKRAHRPPEPSGGTIESKPERCQKHSYAKAPLRNSVEIAAAELMMAIRVVVTSR